MRNNSDLKPKDASWVFAVCLTLLAFSVYFWGIKQNLPFAQEVDEKPIFVGRAVMMAATSTANPGWFGNPGSTIIYPMAMFFRLVYGEGAQIAFDAAPSWFYIFGRLLGVFYATMSIPLTYLIGKKCFDAKIGLLGAWLFIFTLAATLHFKIVRTDSVSVFFGLFSVWRILILYEKPTLRNQIFAGLFIGLSIASRYFMVTLIPILLLVDGLVLKQAIRKKEIIFSSCLGLLTIGLVFIVTTPYFFLDFATALDNLRFEARSEHVGADGLSKPGNLLWYLTTAFPDIMTWPQYLLAILGICFAIWQKRILAILLASYLIVFLLAISLLSLHWARWLIPVIPLFTLFTAYALFVLGSRIFKSQKVLVFVVATCVLLLSLAPIYQTILLDYRLSRPSTRVLARYWILENLPPESSIIQEWYTALLGDTDFAVSETFSLSQNGGIDFYLASDFDYLVVSDNVYNRYFNEPDRYPEQVGFYNTLFEQGNLLTEFIPNDFQGGYTIRIYELNGVAPP